MNKHLLGPLCIKIGSGATPRGGKEVYQERGDIKLIRSQNVYNEYFSRDGLVYILPEHADQLNNVEVIAGDILLNITGDSVARVCQVPPDVLPARVNQHVAIIRPDPNKLDPRFVRFYLASPQMQAHMLSIAGGGGTRHALTKGMIERFQVPDIPLSTQRHISSLLGAIEDKIDVNRRINAALQSEAAIIYKDWFVDFGPTQAKIHRRPSYLGQSIWEMFPDKLDPQKVQPLGWRTAPLEELAICRPHVVDPSDVSPQTPYIGLEHMPRRSIALDTWEGAGKVTSGKVRFRQGDFLFGKLRPYFHKVGIAPVDGIASTDIIICRERQMAARAFVICTLFSDAFVAYTDQTSTGTKMPRTSWGSMARYEVQIPSAELLRAFNDVVSPLFSRLTANINESRTLAQTRDLLLPRLMSGDVQLSSCDQAIGASQ